MVGGDDEMRADRRLGDQGIEDAVDVLDRVTGALERSGFEAIVVTTPDAALAAAAERPSIAAVIADAATGLVERVMCEAAPRRNAVRAIR